MKIGKGFINLLFVCSFLVGPLGHSTDLEVDSLSYDTARVSIVVLLPETNRRTYVSIAPTPQPTGNDQNYAACAMGRMDRHNAKPSQPTFQYFAFLLERNFNLTFKIVASKELSIARLFERFVIRTKEALRRTVLKTRQREGLTNRFSFLGMIAMF
ncbi:hypothetical protein SCHPADRAFT_544121 [Schizopora paradoxa]|uniref:Uncharacterized protein n=1 Tax=Schizopora paradoxa TaxID=27342 RepID=A0A0H2RDM8_9AGAM|nr:hypothetical protein SCHPADRAFT_544121 [Schizopora paradoxa]